MSSEDNKNIVSWLPDCSRTIKESKLTKRIDQLFSVDVFSEMSWFHTEEKIGVLSLSDFDVRYFDVEPGWIRELSSGGGKAIVVIENGSRPGCSTQRCVSIFECLNSGCRKNSEIVDGASISPSGKFIVSWKGNSILVGDSVGKGSSENFSTQIQNAVIDDDGFVLACADSESVLGKIILTKCGSGRPKANPWHPGRFLIPWTGKVIAIECKKNTYEIRQYSIPPFESVWVSHDSLFSFGGDSRGVIETKIYRLYQL